MAQPSLTVHPAAPVRASLRLPAWIVLALVMAGTVVSALWVWNRGAETRAIRHLPADERRALYDRTLSVLRSPCGPTRRTDALEKFCHDQAQFIIEFPECDAECLAVARHHFDVSSR
jgi:hypothetical protein